MIHVLPINDLRAHTCSTECWCHPDVDDDEGEGIAIHHSMDRREEYEEGRMPS